MTMAARIGNYHLIVTRGLCKVTLRKITTKTVKSRRYGTERKGESVETTWHGNLKQAIERLIAYEFDAEDTATMKEVLAAIKRIEARIETWTVELENEAKNNCGQDSGGEPADEYGDDDDNGDS